MSSISVRIGVTLSIGLMLLAAACTDARKGSTIFDSKTGKHPDNWVADHPASFLSDASQCTSCHGSDLKGGISGVSCYSASFNGMSCHANGPSGHPAGWNDPTQHGASAKAAPSSSTGFADCEQCHGADFSGGFATTCLNTAGCHGAGVDSPHAFPWKSTSTRKHSTTDVANATACGLCHLANRQPPSYVILTVPVGCFDNTLCHGQVGHAAGWNDPTQHGAAAKSAPSATAMQGFSTCQSCHGANFNGGAATTCFTCHGVSAPHASPWTSTSPRKHSTTNVANASSCGLCHLANRQPPSYVVLTVPVGCFDNTLCHGQVGHPAGWNVPAAHGAAAKSLPSVTAMQGFSTCQTCHGTNFGGGAATTCLNTVGCHGVGVNSPHAQAPWISSAMTHTSTNTANVTICGYCHEGESTNGNHAYTPPTGPVGCFDNTLCHGVQATTCVGCHGSPQGTRDAVVGEFGLAWGHKKSGRGAVTDADCIVCHLEGNYATQARSGLHGDGNIDLRDPDGAGETPITNMTGGAFTFTKFATSYAAGSRTSTGHTLNNIDNVLTQKFCLACHDSNGAANPTARSNNGGTGTAAMPFGGVALGANYTAANNAIGTQGLIDVNTQFATTNSSVHPVRGPRNKDFPTPARLIAPYNNFTRAGTSGTKTNGVVLNCFDCHNNSTPLTNRTNVAHGAAGTLRGTTYAANPSLCLTCHFEYNVTNTQVHGPGSAWGATGSSHGTGVVGNCHYCHGSNTNATKPARPMPAQDYHGSNALPGGGLWTNVTPNGRPFAFIRGWSGTAYQRPFRSTEFTTGSAQCGAGTCPGGGQVGDGTTRNYTPGGSY